MQEFEITRQKVEDLLGDLVGLSKPHPQTALDGKTVSRDFEIPPKARFLLMEDMTTLKELSEKKEEKRMNLVKTHLPRGEAGHTPEEMMLFQEMFSDLMKEKVKVELYQVWIYDEKTDKPDAIDLTKCPIPFGMLINLNRIILIAPPGSGNSEASGESKEDKEKKDGE